MASLRSFTGIFTAQNILETAPPARCNPMHPAPDRYASETFPFAFMVCSLCIFSNSVWTFGRNDEGQVSPSSTHGEIHSTTFVAEPIAQESLSDKGVVNVSFCTAKQPARMSVHLAS